MHSVKRVFQMHSVKKAFNLSIVKRAFQVHLVNFTVIKNYIKCVYYNEHNYSILNTIKVYETQS